MAIGVPSQLATQTSQTSGQTSLTLALGSGIAANTLVIVAVYLSNAGTAVGDPSSVAAGANSYVMATSALRSLDHYTSIWSFYYASAPGAQTVTASFASANMTNARAWSVSGINTPALDQVGTNNGLSGSATVTAAGANAQADELVFVTIGLGNNGVATTLSNWPPTTGYSTLGTQSNLVRSKDVGYAYKIVAAGETSSSADTLLNSEQWAFPLATFKGAAAAAGGSRPLIVVSREASRRSSRW